MKLGEKNASENCNDEHYEEYSENYYEEYSDDYEEALKEFMGGQGYFYSNGFEDEIYNYRQLIKFLGENILKEERETKAKIKDAWDNHEDITLQYAHVKILREFTLHSTFLSIHSMYECRLKEYCSILAHYGRKKIGIDRNVNLPGLMGRINSNVTLDEDINGNNKLREFYCEIRNKIVHQKGYIKSNDPKDLKLMSKIEGQKYLHLTRCRIGKYDFQLHIKNSMFLTDYLSLINQDLKIICRSAMKL